MASAPKSQPRHRAFLAQFTCGDILTKQRLIALSANATLEDALRILAEKNIISSPVRHPPGVKPSNPTPFVGIIGMQQIASAIANCPEMRAMEDAKFDVDKAINESAVLKRTVVSLLGPSPPSYERWVFRNDDPLDRVLVAFGQGLHHVLVSSKADSPQSDDYQFLSQSDVVRFLWNSLLHQAGRYQFLTAIAQQRIDSLGMVLASKQQLDDLQKSFSEVDLNEGRRSSKKRLDPTVAFKSLADLGLKFINVHQSALAGFHVIAKHHIAAVAVVDERGCLVETLSASDLRGLNHANFKTTTMPVAEFLEHLREQRGQQKRKAVSVPHSATLGQVMQLVAEKRVHRVWVLDVKGRPVGVITLSDIIGRFAVEAPVAEHQQAPAGAPAAAAAPAAPAPAAAPAPPRP